ncbi:MAG: S1/P1 nuclease [Bdellovibrio sp.]|nr:S1/P1 nuclease [Bdellovibrio sp.]
MKKMILFIITLMFQPAFAWGPTGHRVVGELAQNYLTLKAQVAVGRILKGQSLARVANWPDEIKSDSTYAYTYSWHYTEWADGQDQFDPNKVTGILVAAIEENIKLLKNSETNAETKVFALKFLIHLIGDIHQPLHVGNGLDRGGNDCKVTYHNVATNLHALWDESMIDFTHLSFTEWVSFLNVLTAEEIASMQKGTVLDWAQESKLLRAQIYPAEVTADPASNLPQVPGLKNYCNKAQDLPATSIPKLGYNYSYQFKPMLEKRLTEAGLRLAMTLNAIFE